MKKLLLLLLCVPLIGFGQQTIIPDANFEQALINLGYDTGTPNGSVPTANIDTVTSLNVSNQNIADLTGIEDFTALTRLYCDSNQISILDASQNNYLTELHCNFNQNLTSIDIDSLYFLETVVCENNNNLTHISMRYASIDGGSYSNPAPPAYYSFSNNYLVNIDWIGADLEWMDCSNNQLVSLDLTELDIDFLLDCSHNNINTLIIGYSDIEYLACSDNLITTLDVSNAVDLDMGLACSNNPLLTHLNVANGENSEWFSNFGAINTPQLTCITVDNVNFSNNTWTVSGGNIDPQHYFSTNCPLPSAIEEYSEKKDLLKVTGLLGRETKSTKNEVLFYIYDDGTVEKKIIIE